MSIATTLAPLLAWIALLVPLLYLLLGITLPSGSSPNPDILWQRRKAWAAVALATSLALAPALISGPAASVRLWPAGDNFGALTISVRLDAVTALMLVLVTFVGLIIIRYSHHYLEGDTGQLRYLRWLLMTLAAVTLLVISNNLLLLAAAWVGTSLCLHCLLTFFRDRPQALIAAHKKFLISRAAELCLLLAVYLTGSTLHTVELDGIYHRLAQLQSIPAGLHWAAVLFTVSAALKCAQLPFQGWLIQVMEAPTPVSALLHAGIVNIGGFLMIRLMPLMLHSEAAQILLVLLGGTSACVAALVMMTRSSIKVSLAWSTCAQMGFMLMECGLGAYSLALLHLLAHSLYKAHAFLSAGSTVDDYRVAVLAPKRRPRSLFMWLIAPIISAAFVYVAGSLAGINASEEPYMWALGAVLALALPPMMIDRNGAGHQGQALITTGAAMLLALVYFAWHDAFAALLGTAHAPVGGDRLTLGIALTCFAALYLLQAWMDVFPQSRFACWLYPHASNGFYLDEIATRITFRIWPASSALRQARTTNIQDPRIQEQQS